MRKFFIISVLIIHSVSLWSQDVPEIIMESCSNLVVSGNIKITLRHSDKSSLIFLSDDQMKTVSVDVKNDLLKISAPPTLGNKSNAEPVVLNLNQPFANIKVTKGAWLSSSDTLSGDELKLSVGSGGKIEFPVSARTITAAVSNGGDIILSGTVHSQQIEVSSWGNYLAYDLESSDTRVTTKTGGQAKVVARRIIDATARSSSYIGYIGEPESTFVKTSANGKIASFKTRKLATGI